PHALCADAAPTELCTLSLHDALPIYGSRNDFEAVLNPHGRSPRQPDLKSESLGLLRASAAHPHLNLAVMEMPHDLASLPAVARQDRKSTRLNSSHVKISYAVFCLKKK